MTLADVLYSAPGLLELLAPDSLGVLLNTCRRVRETLQETITSIRLPASSTDQLVNCQLLAHGHWPSLQHLSLMHLQLDTASVTELAAADWPKLQCLNMSGSTLEAAALLPLTSNNWPQMRSLDVSRFSVCSATLAVLASCNWKRLQHINLADTQLDADAVAVLVKAEWPRLLSLNISHNPLQPPFTSHIANARWPLLTALDLSMPPGFRLDTTAVADLLKAEWPQLECLRLNSALEPSAALSLASGAWRQLKALHLCNNRLGVSAMAHLVSASWPLLEQLTLSANNLDAEAVGHLAKSKFQCLTDLDLSSNNLGADAMQELANGSLSCQLKILQLSCNDLNAIAIAHFVSADWSGLQSLHLLEPSSCPGLNLNQPCLSCVAGQYLQATGCITNWAVSTLRVVVEICEEFK